MKLTTTVIILTVLTTTCATAEDTQPATRSDSPARLGTIISLATAPTGETPEQAKLRAKNFDTEIDRLLETLSDASGKKLKPPVRLSGLPNVPAAESVTGSYMHSGDEQNLKSVKDSIVVIEPDGKIESAENSVVIFACRGELSKVRNSIVLARYEVNVRNAENSVILSGCDANLNSETTDSICGARGRLWFLYPYMVQDTVFVNSKIVQSDLPESTSAVQVKGLDLAPAPGQPLAGNVEITAVTPELVLLRTKDGKGEYVARRGESVLDPEGRPVAALAGWRLEYSTPWDSLVVFEKEGRRAALQVVPAEYKQTAHHTSSEQSSSDDDEKSAARRRSVKAATDPVRVETLIRLATGPDDETPEEAKTRAARFDREIDRLLALLSHGSRRDIKPPARMSRLPVAKVTVTIDGGYVRVPRKQQLKSARNSIVVLEEDSSIRSAENCIVIVLSDADFGVVRNSVLLARYDANLYARDSVVLCGLDLFFVNASGCVCGAGREFGTEQGIQNSLIVNTPKISARNGDNARTLKIAGLELAARQDDSLKNVVEVTFTARDPQKFVLLRMKEGKGEYVARLGRPVLDPDGRPVAAFEGWQLEQMSNAGYVVFVKPGRYAELPVKQP